VDDALILETSFLIDLERETTRGAEGEAHDLLARHPRHRLFITPTVAGELASGTSMSDRARWESFVAPFHVLAIDRDVCWHYGDVFRYLQANGLLIGTNDLWIAAAGIAYGVPVVTRNTQHFERVPGLRVLSYSEGSKPTERT
jgi:predicted nucleic acid-binding protein